MRTKVLILASTIFALPALVQAHAFGQQFTLPLPVNFYIVGGVLGFIASCVVLLLFSKPTTDQSMEFHELRFRGYAVLLNVLGVVGLSLATLAVVIGFVGPQDFNINPVPNFFWIIFLLLFAYTSAIVGGLWRYIDPFRVISTIAASKVPDSGVPRWMPYMPALLFFALLWLELFSPGWGASPIVLGSLFFSYATLCIVMSRIYGVQTWFENGEMFSIFFGLIGKIAPIQFRNTGIRIGVPGGSLMTERPLYTGILVFILFMLSSTIYDGIRETGIWWSFIFTFNLTDTRVLYVTGLAVLAVLPIALFGLYSLAISQMKRLTKTDISIRVLRLEFAYSLVPIALAYHFAHYFSLILSNGQIFFSQISDPLQRGWNLFGTATYEQNLNLIGADKVWYLQLGAIVFGHILAALVAHRIAQRVFKTERNVILSQLPMLVLMVALTAFGLWTLGQPFATR